MRKILIPTDFSHNSLKALDYVVTNVKDVAVEVILIWVNSIRGKDILMPETEGTSIEKAAVSRLEQIIRDYFPKLKDGSKMSYRIREGKVHHEVVNQAKYDDVDLIACGTHGASGFEEHYIGSNAYRIVMYSKSPVITVRPNYRFRSSSHIFVLPIDSSTDTRQKVPFTCKLARMAKAEIHILGVYSSKLSSIKRKVDNYVAQVEKFITEEDVKFTTVFRDADNITKTAIAYAESVDADLISITTEQESSAWSFLLGTYAEQMIGSSEIPVLSITPKVLATTSFS
jgi:nucleotide-binding universal stress UspA family protein